MELANPVFLRKIDLDRDLICLNIFKNILIVEKIVRKTDNYTVDLSPHFHFLLKQSPCCNSVWAYRHGRFTLYTLMKKKINK